MMNQSTAERIRIENRLHPDPILRQGEQLIAALSAKPRRIPSQYFYDKRGSELFEAITRQPEYYPTRAEARLLTQSAPRIAELARPSMLVELGSGAATKTRTLLDALVGVGGLEVYVPFDVDPSMVHRVAMEIVEEYPDLRVRGVAGNFLQDLAAIPTSERRLIAFLGSTIGNFDAVQAVHFLKSLQVNMRTGDHFLLGLDLIKDPSVIEAAYNDAAGITAEFDLNMLNVLNERFGFDFDPTDFEHRAIWAEAHHRIEMRLRSLRDQTVRSSRLHFSMTLASGEEILTEISTKYDRELAESLLADGGFELCDWMSLEDGSFGLALAK